MTDLSNIPLQDGYETTLSQELSTSGTTIYLKAAPSYSTTTTDQYITINPKKSNAEVIKVTSYDSSAKTFTVDTRGIARYEGDSGTAQTHAVGSKVIISDNYKYWTEIQTAINSKMDTADGAVTAYANATARDAAITSPANGMQAYLTDTGKFTDYTAGSWVDRESGGTFPNASTTVAGKKEDPTNAQTIAGTDIGETGASMSPTCSQVAANIQSGTFISGTAAGTDTYTLTLTPTLTAYGQGLYVVTFTNGNTGAATINIDTLGAKDIQTLDGGALTSGDIAAGGIYVLYYDGTQFKLISNLAGSKTRTGGYEMATDAEATTGTDETRVLNSKQMKDNYLMVTDTITITRSQDAATGSVNYSHGLGKAPKLIQFSAVFGASRRSYGAYDGTTNNCVYVDGSNSEGVDGSNAINIALSGTSYGQTGVVSATTTTNFTIDWTRVDGSSGTDDIYVVVSLIA